MSGPQVTFAGVSSGRIETFPFFIGVGFILNHFEGRQADMDEEGCGAFFAAMTFKAIDEAKACEFSGNAGAKA